MDRTHTAVVRNMGVKLVGAATLLVIGIVGGVVAAVPVFGAIWHALYLSHNNHGDPVPWFLPLMAIPPLLVSVLTFLACIACVAPGLLLLLRPRREHRSEAESADGPEESLAGIGLLGD